VDEQVCREVVQVSLAGEIIALDNDLTQSFNQLQHQRSGTSDFVLYVHVIIYRGRRLILVSFETRCELLSDIAAELKSHTPLVGSSDTLDPMPTELICLAS
jgi:ATP-dependent DNA ligase